MHVYVLIAHVVRLHIDDFASKVEIQLWLQLSGPAAIKRFSAKLLSCMPSRSMVREPSEVAQLLETLRVSDTYRLAPRVAQSMCKHI